MVDAVEEQLAHQPTMEKRNSKPLRPNPVAHWELRVGDLRVYYDIEDEPEPVVHVRAPSASMCITCSGSEEGLFRYEDRRARRTSPLADYVQGVREEPQVITDHGTPTAVILPLTDVNLESIALSTNPEFISLIERSR